MKLTVFCDLGAHGKLCAIISPVPLNAAKIDGYKGILTSSSDMGCVLIESAMFHDFGAQVMGKFM